MKDWKKGTIQIGLFIRTDDGLIEAVSNAAPPEAKVAAGALFLRLFEKRVKLIEPSGDDAPEEAREKADRPMNLWRIVNPTKTPTQVIFESRGEQVARSILAELRKKTHVTDDVVGDVSALTLVMSEDRGKSWAQVEERVPDDAAPVADTDKPKPSAPVAEKS